MQHPLWHKIPLVRLLIPFASGIVCSLFLEIPFGFIGPGFVLLFCTSVIVHQTLKQYRFRWVFGVSMNLCLFTGGWALHQYQNELRSDEHYHSQKTAQYIFVKVEEQPAPKSSGYKLVGTAIGIRDSLGQYKPAMGKLSVFIGKKDLSNIPVYGDVLVIPASKTTPVKGPQNPDEFDFKRYLAFKQIYFQAYLNSTDIILPGENRSVFIMRWVYHVQAYFKDVLSRYIGSQNESAVAEALLYGYDDDIDDETKQAYANTGTLHVLAVSGMHVGIIYMILGLVLAPFSKFKKGKITKQLIILLLLWVYSFICGLSPSILRATVMFSFIIIADVMDEHSSVYNTLAASAFVLLCFDTNMIANVGFQLSYLAVLGIVFFQPFIATMYTAPNWFIHQVWSITAVSLAAQLITFPIGLYYFHQFPICFLISNLIIIPLTTLILYTGIVLLVVSKFSWLAWLLGKLMYYLIHFTNDIAKWIEYIPYAYVNGIQVSIVQSILLYAIVCLLTLFFIRQQQLFLKAALWCGIVYGGIQSYAEVSNMYQERLVVYHIPKQNAIQWMIGNNALVLADSSLITNSSKMKFHTQQHVWNSGIEQQQMVYTDSMKWQKITIAGSSIVIAGKENFSDSLVCDILIVKYKVDLPQILKYINPGQVILTSAVKPADAAVMQDCCSRKNIETKYVGEKGAIQLSLLK